MICRLLGCKIGAMQLSGLIDFVLGTATCIQDSSCCAMIRPRPAMSGRSQNSYKGASRSLIFRLVHGTMRL